jgi:hypothetical protein
MSRGLSRQQLQILGLAVAVSRLCNGTPLAHVPRSSTSYRVPITRNAWPDASVALAAHVLGGVVLRPRDRSGASVWLETTPAALNTRSAFSRAITSLLRRGLLVYVPHSYLSPLLACGYALTAAGLTIGAPNELAIADLERRIWLLNGTGRRVWRPDWAISEALPSPQISVVDVPLACRSPIQTLATPETQARQ